MSTKGKKGFAKRILAMLMTLLMVWSLIPANAYVVFAAENTYTFTVTETTTDGTINVTDATIKLYSTEDFSQEIATISSTYEENAYKIVADVDGDCWYKVEKEGYTTVTGGPISADAQESVTLTATQQEDPTPIIVTVNGKITDAALTENATLAGVNVVISTEGEDDVNVTTAEDGSYSFNAVVGKTYTITAALDGYQTKAVEYIAAEDSTTVDISLSTKTSIVFDFAVSSITLKVGKSTESANAFIDPEALEGYTIKYSSSDDTTASVDEATGIVTALKAGTVTITATIEETETTLESTATYEVVVQDKAESNLVFVNGTTDGSTVNAIWNTTFESILAKVEDIENAVVNYESSDPTVATVDQTTGVVTILKPGETTITASFAGNDDYKAASITYVLNVEKAEQSDFGWTDAENVFGDNVAEDGITPSIDKVYTDSTITIGTSDNVGDVTYESSNTEVATVNPATGEVTFVKADTVIITATAAGDEYYAEKTISYELVIAKVSQTIEFDTEQASSSMFFGGSFTLPSVIITSPLSGTGEITYSLADGSDEDIVAVAVDGALTFGTKTGTVTIIATKAADEYYASATAEYTLTVEEWDPLSTGNAEDYYTVTGTMNNGWYVANSSDVLDIAINAETGYEISTDATNWNATVDGSGLADGAENTLSFYLKDTTNGYISKQYSVENVKVDKTAPEATINEVVNNVTLWDAILIFFGLKEENPPAFEINATDVTSGIASKYYYLASGLEVAGIDDVKAFDASVWLPYSEQIVVNIEGEYVLYAKVVDNAGNCTYTSSCGFIYDETAPTVSTNIATTPVVLGGSNYYIDDVTIDVVASDLTSGIQSIKYQIFCDGEATLDELGELYGYTHTNTSVKGDLTTVWDENHPNYKSIVVNADENNSANVKVVIYVTDNAGNVTEQEVSLSICKETPTISVEFSNDLEPNGVNNGIKYFQDYRVAQVVFTSRDDVFVKENVTWNIVALGANGETVDSAYELNWKDDAGDGTYVATITFAENAKYNFTIDYTNALGVDAETYTSETFVIDDEAPTAKVTYGEPLWQVILETITFGIWTGNEVEVKVEDAQDGLSDIKSIQYYIHNIDFTSENPVVALRVDELDALSESQWVTYDANNLYKTTEGAEASFVYYAKVTDWAGNYAYVSNGVIIDNSDSAITITPETSLFESGYYNSDVYVLIDVTDQYSGIKKVTYWVEFDVAGSMQTSKEETVLYEDKGENDETVLHRWQSAPKGDDDAVVIKAVNSKKIVIHVTVEDKVGRVISKEKTIKISTEKPSISVTYDDVEQTGETKVDPILPCYKEKRTATIKIIGNSDLFLEKYVNISGVSSIEWQTPDINEVDVHTAIVTFEPSDTYNFTVDYTDDVGSKADQYKDSFIVDNVAPTGELSIGNDLWKVVFEALTLGLWSPDDLTVRVEATDELSGIKSGEYIMLTGENALRKLTNEELADPSKVDPELAWQTHSTFTVDKDLTFAIYLKITDCAGNVTFINSNGYTVDKTGSSVTITPTTEPNNKGYYNGDILVDINVKEFWGDMESYSGINTVKYWIEKDGDLVKEEVLMDYAIENPATFEDLVTEFSKQITIKAEDCNSDNVVLYVEVVDNAGNISVNEEGDLHNKAFKIDITKPTIDITYDNNENITTINELGIYNADRIATIVITERKSGFDATAESIKVVAKDKDGNVLSNVTPVISGWTTDETEGNPDATTHTATVTFSEDAYYTLEVSYTDNAGNENEEVATGESKDVYAFVLDKTEAKVTLTPEIVKDCYNGDVKLILKVDDAATTSGIKSVKYWVTSRNISTQTNEAFYVYKTTIDRIFDNEIIVISEKNNSCTVLVKVEVVDNAGNVTTKEVPLDIDIDAPTISVEFDNNDVKYTDEDGKGYYDSSRVATIVVTQRAEHFKVQEFLDSIIITAKDSENKDVEGAFDFPTVEDVKSEDGVHTLKITFTGDANYTFDFKPYIDVAGNVAVFEEGSKSSYNFAVDTKNPTATIKVGEWTFIEKFFNAITFGMWSPSAVDIVITANDTTSPIESVQYFKTSTFTLGDGSTITEKTIETFANGQWVDYEEFSVGEDDIFVIYVKVKDYAGRITYISSDGIIVDKTKPVFEQIAPEITITPQQPVNGIYSGDVKVDVSVKDPKDAETNAFAGIREIRYEIYNTDNTGKKEMTQSGRLYPLPNESIKDNYASPEELLESWSTTNSSSVGYGQSIIVDSTLNNSNNVEVRVYAIDNAGNGIKLEDAKSIFLKIDTTRPTIDISYDNNVGDTTFADGVYFDANRVATITITERNFDPNKVSITLKNSDGVVPKLSEWKTVNANGNGDNTTHTATLTYTADGDYTFDIAYSDNAGNISEAADYGDSLAPTEFTIDKTLPVISVEYDNNDVLNGNYYKADRLATITITEQNFDASRVKITILAFDDEKEISAPVESDWKSFGDTHTATISYDEDALYTFDIEYVDNAGNAAADFTQQRFYVDKTAPTVTITGIVDQSANNDEIIGFEITVEDTNFDEFNPSLVAIIKDETGFDTKDFTDIGVINTVNKNSKKYVVSNISDDGIYSISCVAVDKAGNAYTHVTLENTNGNPEVKELTSSDTLVKFSVNRGGSAFETDEKTKNLIEDFYVYEVNDDIEIVEVNSNKVTSYEVTLNGKVLVEGKDYNVTPDENSVGTWMKYRYVLKKSLFMEEGQYTVVISSKDEAENNAFSDIKNTKISFVVDRTAPVVTITGLKENEVGYYRVDEKHTVTFTLSDDGGAIASLLVRVTDSNGNVREPFNLSGEALLEAISNNDGIFSFDIESNGQTQFVEIICNDNVVKEDGEVQGYHKTFEVFVTSSALAAVMAQYSTIIIIAAVVVLALLTGTIVFVVRRKAKKDKMIIRK